ncbi:hypothetical protein KFE25_004550 [Diacronema lutheri]|uniref:Uncharacterized protein n=1 Tax=Diacronema lutheri TaxID=2081491 RepID=A0A8J6C2F6_DIALT|nr:hypothetical protein KFE25_004550 [Diacronema lutheri]
MAAHGREDNDEIIAEFEEAIALLAALHGSAALAHSAASCSDEAYAGSGGPAARGALRRSAEAALRLADRWAGWARIAHVFLGRLSRERAVATRIDADNALRSALAQRLVEAAGGALDALPHDELPDARRAVRDLALALADWRSDVESARASFSHSRASLALPSAPHGSEPLAAGAARAHDAVADAPSDAKVLARAAARRQRKVLSREAELRGVMHAALTQLAAAHRAIAPHEHTRRKAVRAFSATVERALTRLPAPPLPLPPFATSGGGDGVGGDGATGAQAVPRTRVRAPAAGAVGATRARSDADAADAEALGALRRVCVHLRALGDAGEAAEAVARAGASAAAPSANAGAPPDARSPVDWRTPLSALGVAERDELRAALARAPRADGTERGRPAAAVGMAAHAEATEALLRELGAAGVRGVRADTLLGELDARARVALAGAEAAALARSLASYRPDGAGGESAARPSGGSVGGAEWADAMLAPAGMAGAPDARALRAALGLAPPPASAAAAATGAPASAAAVAADAAAALDAAARAAGLGASPAEVVARAAARTEGVGGGIGAQWSAAELLELFAASAAVPHAQLPPPADADGGVRRSAPAARSAGAREGAGGARLGVRGLREAACHVAWSLLEEGSLRALHALLGARAAAPRAATGGAATDEPADAAAVARAHLAGIAADLAWAEPCESARNWPLLLEALGPRSACRLPFALACSVRLPVVAHAAVPASGASPAHRPAPAQPRPPVALAQLRERVGAALRPASALRLHLAELELLPAAGAAVAGRGGGGGERLWVEAWADTLPPPPPTLAAAPPPVGAVGAPPAAARPAASARGARGALARTRVVVVPRAGSEPTALRSETDPIDAEHGVVVVSAHAPVGDPPANRAVGTAARVADAATSGTLRGRLRVALARGAADPLASSIALVLKRPSAAAAAARAASAANAARGHVADGADVLTGGELGGADEDEGEILGVGTLSLAALCSPSHADAAERCALVEVAIVETAATGRAVLADGVEARTLASVLVEVGPLAALVRMAPRDAADAPPPPRAAAGEALAARRGAPSGGAAAATALAGARDAAAAARAAVVVQRWLRAHQRRSDFTALRAVPGGREAFAAALAAADGTPNLNPEERAAAALSALSRELATPRVVSAQLTPLSASLQLQLSAAQYAATAGGGGGGGGGGRRGRSPTHRTPGSPRRTAGGGDARLGGGYGGELEPRGAYGEHDHRHDSALHVAADDRLVGMLRKANSQLDALELALRDAKLDAGFHAAEAARLRELLRACQASQAALGALALGASAAGTASASPGEGVTATRALGAVGALREENEALMAALGQWVDETHRLRAQIADAAAARATSGAQGGTAGAQGKNGACASGGGTPSAHAREIAAVQAAMRAARDGERSARKAALDAATSAAERVAQLEQRCAQSESALRRAKLDHSKLSRELEEVKQRTNAVLLKAADDHGYGRR